MNNLESWTRQTIFEEIIRAARGHEGLYRSHLIYERTGSLSFNVAFEYVKDGKPVGVFLERGTKPHKIRAKFKLFLRWFTTARAARFFPQFNRVRGDITLAHFAKEVNHPGTTGIRAMDIGAQYGMPKLMNRIIRETNIFLQETKMT